MRKSKLQCDYEVIETEVDNGETPEDKYHNDNNKNNNNNNNNNNQTMSNNDMSNFFVKYTTLIAVISLLSILGYFNIDV